MARYIDADELKQERDMAIKAYENANIFTATAIREHIKPLLDKIVDLPTADVMEVKRGEWKQGVPYVCSICGKPAPDEKNTSERYSCWTSPYCPHCGAKMDGQ